MLKMTSQRGFTLLEMLVSLGIFTIVAVISVGALVRIIGLNRQAQTLQSSMNNLGFALESMSREMRVGTQHTCLANTIDLISGANGWGNSGGTSLSMTTCDRVSNPTQELLLAFASAKIYTSGLNSCQLIFAYRLRDDAGKWKLEKAQQEFCGDIPTFYSILDDDNIHLTNYQIGLYRGTANYPWTSIRFEGYAGTKENEKNFFDVQTSIAARISDLTI